MSYISSKTVRLSQLEIRDLSKLTKILYLFQMRALSSVSMPITQNNTQILIFYFLRFLHQLAKHYTTSFLLTKLLSWSHHMADRGRREDDAAFFIEDTIACLLSYDFNSLFAVEPDFDKDFPIFKELDSVSSTITDCLVWKPSDMNDSLLRDHHIEKGYQHESSYSLMNSLRTNVITKFMLLEEVLESLTATVFKSIDDLWDAVFDICGVMAIIIIDYRLRLESEIMPDDEISLSESIFRDSAIKTIINDNLNNILDDITVVRFNHNIPEITRRIRNLCAHRFKKYAEMRKNTWKFTYHVVPSSLISIYTTQFYCKYYARKSRV